MLVNVCSFEIQILRQFEPVVPLVFAKSTPAFDGPELHLICSQFVLLVG